MKTTLGAVPLVYPIPIVLAGANVQDKANFCTLGDCGVMGINPPLVYVSLHRDHYTTQGIVENNSFSINIPSTDMLPVIDYCGIVSGQEQDKAALFDIFYGELGTAPMIESCPVNMECRVAKTLTIKQRHIFVGWVVQTYVDQIYVSASAESDGRRVISSLIDLDPIIYALDNHYYKIGPMIGVGYEEGRDFHLPDPS